MKKLLPLLLLPLLAHAPLLACAGGVYEGLLADPSAALAAPPETAFAVEIARIAGDTEFKFTGADENQALVDGLDALLRRRRAADAEREKRVFAYAEYRIALAAPQSKHAGVFARPGKTPELRYRGENEYGEKQPRTWAVHPVANLPRAYALYEQGAQAWRERLKKERAKAFESDKAAGDDALSPCVEAWSALLALPQDDRRELTVPARFMLAKAALADSQKRGAREAIEAVRAAVRAGAPDPAGFAAATYQLERHLASDDFETADTLIRIVGAGGPEWQRRELRRVLNGILNETTLHAGKPERLAELAKRHPQVREAMAALITSEPVDGWPNYDENGAFGKKVSGWLAFIEATQSEFPEAPLLAAVAYRHGDYAAAQRWADKAKPAEPLGALIASRLLLRQGLVDKAADRLAGVVPAGGALYRVELNAQRAAAERLFAVTRVLPYQGIWNRPDLDAVDCPDISAPFCGDGPMERGQPLQSAAPDPLALRAMAAGELAALRLKQGRPAEALALFLRCAHWRDAARVAERHMTTAELLEFVSKLPSKDSEPGPNGITPEGYLRYIAGRRLCREARFAEAEALFPSPAKPVLREYVKMMKAAFDLSRPDRDRALDMLAAARLMADKGELIFLSVTGPRLRGGDIEDPDKSVDRRTKPSRDDGRDARRIDLELPPQREGVRLATLGDRVARLKAFDLAYAAASLLPNDDPLAAEIYWKLGRYQARNSDSELAERCQRALLIRCPRTEIGQKVAATGKLPLTPEEERDPYSGAPGF